MIKLTQNIISILILALLSNYSFGKNKSKSNRVIDGDTIVLNSKKIRFHGIDTPETHQKCKNDKGILYLSLIHISEPTRRTPISYAVFCLKKAEINQKE